MPNPLTPHTWDTSKKGKNKPLPKKDLSLYGLSFTGFLGFTFISVVIQPRKFCYMCVMCGWWCQEENLVYLEKSSIHTWKNTLTNHLCGFGLVDGRIAYELVIMLDELDWLRQPSIKHTKGLWHTHTIGRSFIFNWSWFGVLVEVAKDIILEWFWEIENTI